MNFMPVTGMLIGILIGWISRTVFEDFREVWNGIDKRDAERARYMGKES